MSLYVFKYVFICFYVFIYFSLCFQVLGILFFFFSPPFFLQFFCFFLNIIFRGHHVLFFLISSLIRAQNRFSLNKKKRFAGHMTAGTTFTFFSKKNFFFFNFFHFISFYFFIFLFSCTQTPHRIRVPSQLLTGRVVCDVRIIGRQCLYLGLADHAVCDVYSCVWC